MNAHISKLNGMSLPCPRCHNLAPIEARVCSCGYKFLASDEPVIDCKLPELNQVIPEENSGLSRLSVKKCDEDLPIGKDQHILTDQDVESEGKDER